MTKRTSELAAGDRVRVGPYLRTVSEILPTPWVNYLGRPIVSVNYAEGDTREWSGGNTASLGFLWEVVGS